MKDVGKWIPTLPEKMLMGIISLLEDNLVKFMKSPVGKERVEQIEREAWKHIHYPMYNR